MRSIRARRIRTCPGVPRLRHADTPRRRRAHPESARNRHPRVLRAVDGGIDRWNVARSSSWRISCVGVFFFDETIDEVAGSLPNQLPFLKHGAPLAGDAV